MNIQNPRRFQKTGLLSISLLIIIFVSACTSTENMSADSGSEYENVDLTTILKRMSGVTVRGSGENASIAVRGREGGSLESNKNPLFVIDGQAINSSYSQIYHMVDSFNIKDVRILSAAQASRYGNQAINGVIEITTK